jgi:hypothetical protein
MFNLNERLVECIEGQSSSIWLSNNNAMLQTSIVRVMGAKVEENKQHIIMYVPTVLGAELLQNLSFTSKLTFLTAAIFTYESYQIKGSYVSQQACTEKDIDFQRQYIHGFTDALACQGLSKEKGFKAYYQQPSIALRLRAEEVYEQTPKQGTGQKLTQL